MGRDRAAGGGAQGWDAEWDSAVPRTWQHCRGCTGVGAQQHWAARGYGLGGRMGSFPVGQLEALSKDVEVWGEVGVCWGGHPCAVPTAGSFAALGQEWEQDARMPIFFCCLLL